MIGLRRRRRPVSQRRIHELEYELGFREDPPPALIDPQDVRFGAGTLIPISGPPQDWMLPTGDGSWLYKTSG